MPASNSGEHAHRRRRLTGRDPLEAHRSATPLELLYDLTMVVAIGTAANELAHYVAAGHVRAGVFGFAFAVFAVIDFPAEYAVRWIAVPGLGADTGFVPSEFRGPPGKGSV